RIRVLVTEALTTSQCLEEFEAGLAAIGLRLEAGQKDGMPILMTGDGAKFVGSLSRLTRFTKDELKQRMAFHGRYPSSASNRGTTPQVPYSADEAGLEAGKHDGGSEPAGSDRNLDSAAGGN